MLTKGEAYDVAALSVRPTPCPANNLKMLLTFKWNLVYRLMANGKEWNHNPSLYMYRAISSYWKVRNRLKWNLVYI